ncbi:UNVERIFIED_ORG: hypothetical protein M2193_000167 [Bradyrhizobium japonicum]
MRRSTNRWRTAPATVSALTGKPVARSPRNSSKRPLRGTADPRQRDAVEAQARRLLDWTRPTCLARDDTRRRYTHSLSAKRSMVSRRRPFEASVMQVEVERIRVVVLWDDDGHEPTIIPPRAVTRHASSAGTARWRWCPTSPVIRHEVRRSCLSFPHGGLTSSARSSLDPVSRTAGRDRSIARSTFWLLVTSNPARGGGPKCGSNKARAFPRC